MASVQEEHEEEKRGDLIGVAEKEEEEAQKSTMAETEENPQEQQQPQQQQNEINKKFERMSVSLSIWPPTQRTRDAVIKRLVETLTTPSILSKRYGSMSEEEASPAARLIEEEAFSYSSSVTSSSSSSSSGENKTGEDDGIETLQVYSKEISRRMLEVIKARAATASPPENATQASDAGAAPVASEEISSVESES